jgi:hypothetical protein
MNEPLSPTTIKLSEMGTTGLVDYVVSHAAGRQRALAKGRAINVLRSRGYQPGAIERFKHAVANTGRYWPRY